MKMKWVVETGLNPEYEGELLVAIKKAGIEPVYFPYKALVAPPFEKIGNNLFDVVFTGSIPTAYKARKQTRWAGVYYSEYEYNYNIFSMWFNNLLLNRKCVYLPYGEIHDNFDSLQKYFGSEELFIKTNASHKSLGSGVFSKKQIEQRTWLYSEMCVIAKPVKVLREWRFILSENRVISYSQYLPTWEKTVSKDALKLASKLSVFPPVSDDVWVCDIGETESGELKVIEINAFSCSCLYKADIEETVNAVKEMVQVYADSQ
jgi:hypothetical protein